MTQTDFFEMLGAPLNNPRWSWGSKRDGDEVIFLKAWWDQVQPYNGSNFARITYHSKWQDRPVKNGYLERLEHIAKVRQGSPCFLVMCNASDKSSQTRRVKSFDDQHVYPCGRIETLIGEGEADEWIEFHSAAPVQDVATGQRGH